MAFNDIDELANEMISAEFRSGGLFDEAELLREITLDEIAQRLETTLQSSIFFDIFTVLI